MIYQNCSQLPLSVFIRIIEGDNISLLVVKGEYTEVQIAETWAAIYSEYFELSGSSDCRHMMQTVKNIAIAENKILMVNAAVSVLRMGHSETMYSCLKNLGFPVRKIDNAQERNKELDKVVSKAKSLVHVLNESERQLKLLEGGKKATMQDYTNTMVTLGKYQGYRIDPDITSVAEYLAIQKNYKLELEWQQKKA